MEWNITQDNAKGERERKGGNEEEIECERWTKREKEDREREWIWETV